MRTSLATAAVLACLSAAPGASGHASDAPRAEWWQRLVDRPAGVVVRYPHGWSARAHPHSPQLVVASYPLAGNAAAYPEPGRSLPAGGAFIALFVTPVALMRPGDVRRNYPERPAHLAWTNATGAAIEGFGPGWAFRFRANGYGVTAQVALGAGASARTHADALRVVSSLGLTPPRQREQTVRLGGAPMGVAFARGSLWVALDRALVQLDGASGHVRSRVRLPPGGDYRHVAIASGEAWITDGGGPTASVIEVDLATRRIRRVIRLECCAIGVAATAQDVWVTVPRDGPGEVVRIDAASGHVVARIPVGPGPGPIALAGGRVWTWNTSSPTSLMGIDPSTNRVAAVVALPGIGDIAAGPAGLWAGGRSAGVVRLDPRTGRIVRRTASPAGEQQIAVGRDAVYAAQATCSGCSAGFVTRTGVVSGVAGPPLPVGDLPIDVTLGGGALWVANFISGTVSRVPLEP